MATFFKSGDRQHFGGRYNALTTATVNSYLEHLHSSFVTYCRAGILRFLVHGWVNANT
jgi:hypothetical protein